MATFIECNDWVEYLTAAVDLSSDSFRIALSNTAPASETSDPTADNNGTLANVTEIAYTNYSDDLTVDRTLEGLSAAQTGGTLTFDSSVDIVITASGGTLATFRYIYLYDDTVAGDPLVCVWDHGSGISLTDGNSATLTFDASGIFTLAPAA